MGFRGTIKDYPGADALRDVEVLRKAMKGFGEPVTSFTIITYTNGMEVCSGSLSGEEMWSPAQFHLSTVVMSVAYRTVHLYEDLWHIMAFCYILVYS